MSTERDEQAWTAETVTALVDYAENGPPLSDMVRDLVGVARAYAAALRAPQETGWQPMETAKQEGVIWGVSVEGQYMLNWLDEAYQLNTEALPSGWYDVWGDRHQPTHWQPLPPAPRPQEAE